MDIPRPLVPVPPSTLRPSTLHQRAGDDDRSAVCDQLSGHFAAGRLRADELDARLDAAVSAETLLDLRRLVADLPQVPAARAVPPLPPAPRPGWGALDLLALLAVIGCLGFAALAILVLGMSGQGWLVAAGFGGGCVAALGGAALTHLMHRGAQDVTRSRRADQSSAAAHRLT